MVYDPWRGETFRAARGAGAELDGEPIRVRDHDDPVSAMQRIFTREVGRFKVGDIRDYPRGTWEQVAKSHTAKQLGIKGMDSFSRPVEDAARAAGPKSSAKAS